MLLQLDFRFASVYPFLYVTSAPLGPPVPTFHGLKLLLLRIERNLPSLEGGPLVSLQIVHERTEHQDDTQRFDAHAFAVIVAWIGGPDQEGGHIFSQLGSRSRSSVAVFRGL